MYIPPPPPACPHVSMYVCMHLFSPSSLCMHPPLFFSSQRTFSHLCTSLSTHQLYIYSSLSRLYVLGEEKERKREKALSSLLFCVFEYPRKRTRKKSARKGVGISNRPHHEPNTQDKKKKQINSQNKDPVPTKRHSPTQAARLFIASACIFLICC